MRAVPTTRHACAILLLRAAATIRASAASGPSDASAAVVTRALFGLSSPPQIVVFATGGGIQLASYMLTTPGASRSVLDVQMPYSRGSLVQLLGEEPKKYCSAAVANDLATAAYERARTLRNANDGPAVGVGCTAALRSEPMKRGAHRCFVAVRTDGGTHQLALTLAKGARSRSLEDAVVSRIALVALARACGVELTAEHSDALWRLPADDVDGGRSDVAGERLEVTFTPTS